MPSALKCLRVDGNGGTLNVKIPCPKISGAVYSRFTSPEHDTYAQDGTHAPEQGRVVYRGAIQYMVQDRYELPAVQVSDSKEQAQTKMLEEVNSSRANSASKTAESMGKSMNDAAQGIVLGAIKGAAESAKNIGEAKGLSDSSGDLGTAAKQAVEQALSGASESKLDQGKEYFKDAINSFTVRVTEKERAAAKEKLDGKLSSLIPEQDRKLLSDMQHAIVDGDINALSKSVQALKNQPEKLKAFVKEIEKNLKETNADSHIALSKDGKVLLYSSFGSTAVEVGADGSVGVRPISSRGDGSAVLMPGEVLNKEPGDCLKEISDEAVENMTRTYRYKLDNFIKPMQDGIPLNRLQEKPSISDGMNFLKKIEK